MVGIVVEKEELPDASTHGQTDCVFGAAVAPTDMLPVLVRIVLRIQDEQIDAANELDELLIGSQSEFGGTWFLFICGPTLELMAALKGLVIR